MEFLKNNPKLLQFVIVLIVFFILMSMTGEYHDIILLRDGFANKVNSGEIDAIVGFSESFRMLLSGQLPPQLVRLPELNFFNPVTDTSLVFKIIALLTILGLLFKNFLLTTKVTRDVPIVWFKQNWTKLFVYIPAGIIVGFLILPTLMNWFFDDITTSSFWSMNQIINDSAEFVMYEWWPVEIYDPEIEDYDDSAMIKEITRGFSRSILFAIEFIREILLGGIKTIVAFTSWEWSDANEWAVWPGLPWTVVSASAIMIGYYLSGRGLAILAAFSTIYISVFGQWEPSMETLSFVLVAAPISFILGLSLGVWAYKSKTTETVLMPLLNVAQTMPHFSYLVPVMVFFGVGDHAGAIATIIFATPPMIRLTLLGLKKVSPEVLDAGMMSGCNNYQLMSKVLIPSARRDILIGVNQVIMQCLAMAVIASFIGAKGLGFNLLLALNQLKIGQALELGICIVLIAVFLDKLSLAWADKQTDYFADLPFLQRHKYSFSFLVILFVGILLAYLGTFLFKDGINYLYMIPHNKGYTSQLFWQSGVDWIWDTFFFSLQGFNTWLIQGVLIPMKTAYLSMPVIATFTLVMGIGYIIGGIRSALVVGGFLLVIALLQWWERALITAYMASFGVLVSGLIGITVGSLCARSKIASKVILLVCDTFQTFPSFIYLIPVIMLFGVTDTSVLIAVIVYATIPATRYTVEGLTSVPQALQDAGSMSGVNRMQRWLKIEMPLALPHIMLGLNQTVVFALFMVIIGAMIGTDDLGQFILKALSDKQGIGNGLLLGLCVAFIGLAVDHLIQTWAKQRRKLLGID
ncbi:proline/glycine betaine ABC transporter permease [Candidatus Thioglobus sp. NP1]|uniref:ABC transporter permease n=1 Tax=Candidatus Thioglobus sp. NP1 TaxID=2508687 RepID=UPI000DEDB6FF|nr:ABC transporter permease subunit [Candidatus Thioglobus sp. NP1]AXE61976.1 glycine/betaine ABC transporter [Candidatus Thioglobus sp. NP1]